MAQHFRKDIVDVEMNSGTVFRSFLNKTISKDDDKENRYGVRLLRDGEPISMTGSTCCAYFIRPDGSTVIIDGGIIDGAIAYVKLPAACYIYDGPFTLAIRILGGGIDGTIRIIDGTIADTYTDVLVDPGSVIPSLAELEDLIERAEAAAETIETLYIQHELIEGTRYKIKVIKGGS